MESWELSSDSEDENAKASPDEELDANELRNRLTIKQEHIDSLQNTVKKLNNRLGTEIVDGSEDAANFLRPRRYENSKNVNTLHYQNDLEFGKNIYFITNVRKTRSI